MEGATYTLLLDFGSGWEDFSDRILLADGYVPRVCIGRDGSHEIQTVELKVHHAIGLSARLMLAEGDVPARILRDGSNVMRGIVRPYATSRVTLKRMDPLSLSVLDMSATLERYVFDTVRWTGLTLIDRASPGTSLIHRLFGEAGIAASDVLVGFDRSESIPFYSLDNGDYVSDRLQEALYEYGLTYRATADGRFEIIDISPETIVPQLSIGTGDLLTELSLTRSDSSQKGTVVRWRPVLFRGGATVYATEMPDGGSPLAAGGIFPSGADAAGYRLPYDISEHSDGGTLLACGNARVAYTPESLEVSVHADFGADDCSAYIRSTSAAAQTVTAFSVVADIWYRGRSYSQQVVAGARPRTYTAKVIGDAGSALRLARILASRQTVGKQSYAFGSRIVIEPGTLLRITETAVSSLDAFMRVLSRETDEATGISRYTAEGVSGIGYTESVERIDIAENAMGRPRKGDQGEQGKAYVVEIESTNGLVFRPGSQYTTLIAHVYDGTGEITTALSSAAFRWIRTSESVLGDDAWNMAHMTGYKEVVLTPADFYGRTSFKCEIREVS